MAEPGTRRLEIGLKPDFSYETRDAWAAAYGLLASVMIGAGLLAKKAVEHGLRVFNLEFEVGRGDASVPASSATRFLP